MRGAGFGVTEEDRVNLHEVLERVRVDVAARRRGVLNSAAPPLEIATLDVEAVPLPRPADAVEPIPYRDEYDIHELLIYSGPSFVRNAYRALLRREPEAGGMEGHLARLQRGEATKFDLLSDLHESEEGRHAKVRIGGLRLAILAQKWAGVPLVGRTLRWVQAVRAVSVAIASLERQETRLAARESALNDTLAQFAAATEASQAAMNERIARVNESLKAALRRLEREKASTRLAMGLTGTVGAMHFEMAAIAREQAVVRDAAARFQELAGEVEASKADAARTAEELAHIRASGAEHLERMMQVVDKMSLEKVDMAEVEARIAEKMSKRNLEAALAEDDHFLDDFYVAFEERARGTTEDIKERVKIYLPVVKKAGAGTRVAPILDVGCGRGEWLELLGETKLHAHGIDLNAAAVAHCREQGLHVEQAELLEYLEGVKPGSLGAITALHVIEHLSFQQRITFLDAALRALRPGGVAIMETPNPENLTVGSCTFWNDPTHLRPLPPEATKLIVELRGFKRVEVMRLHPFPFEAHLPADSHGTRDSLNHLLFGPQDYSLLAYKE